MSFGSDTLCDTRVTGEVDRRSGRGAGKGTQGALVAERLPGLAHLKSGALFRAHVANGQGVPSIGGGGGLVDHFRPQEAFRVLVCTWARSPRLIVASTPPLHYAWSKFLQIQDLHSEFRQPHNPKKSRKQEGWSDSPITE